jgi:flagellum-specific peptidoglycan hydrolase FlgJ
MTGISFTHGTVSDLTSPTSIPVKLLALNKPARSDAASESALRAAIVKSAQYYLRLAQSRSPSEMESLIWQNDSVDGVDHGESCAAFASLTLESGAQATGQQSWVTGGGTYPWPVHPWVDSRVDPNPESPNVISILQDAQAHHRWHPLGDGYTPQPGDWVLFDGHVEVVTKYAGGVLYTIGGDSMPNLSVNAHQYASPLAAQGVAGFVNNGVLLSAVSQTSGSGANAAAAPGQGAGLLGSAGQSAQGQADIPGTATPALALGTEAQSGTQTQQSGSNVTATGAEALSTTAAIPGALPITGSVTSYSSVASASSASASPRYSRSQAAPSTASAPGTSAQQAFITSVAPGALAAQRQYGIPAAVTIAQAIDESGWGQSQLATQDNNLFGIKGTGPAGSVLRATQEYENGQMVTVNAPFRVYSNVAQSITDHSLLLATGSAYQQAMADRRSPDAFANDLTGVYATDPNYGATLITIMRQYNLYRYDAGAPAAQSTAASNGASRSGQAPSGAGLGSSGLGSGLSSAGHSGTQGGAQPGAAGQNAVIPGAAQVTAAGLGLSGQPTSGQPTSGQPTSGQATSGPTATGHRPSGTGGTAAGRAGARRPVRSAVAKGEDGGGKAGASGAAAGRGSPGGPGSSGAATGGSGPAGAAADRPSGGASGGNAEGSGGAVIPGLDTYAGTAATSAPAQGVTSAHLQPNGGSALRAGPRNVRISTRRYVTQMPRTVLTDFVTTAKIPLLRAKPVYQDVAASSGLHWELLAACDWMQCQAQPGVSPVYGESLGTKNPDGTVYRTKTDALEQCAADLIELAAAIYGINLRQRRLLSVRDLANVFAAFRWGGLLKAHRISAMSFPYSVEGLSAQHTRMRWPEISEEAPDKPGTRFRMSFGAVPVVLRLNYPAIA